MSHRNARALIEKNKSRLAKHFSDEGDQLDRETVRRLQLEIEQAEMHLTESEDDVEDWHHGDNYN